jgi:hypothetical protein
LLGLITLPGNSCDACLMSPPVTSNCSLSVLSASRGGWRGNLMVVVHRGFSHQPALASLINIQ